MSACQEMSCRRELCESCDKVFPQEAKRLETEREAKEDAVELKKYRRSLTFKVRARPYVDVVHALYAACGALLQICSNKQVACGMLAQTLLYIGNVQQSPSSKSDAAGHQLKIEEGP